MYKLFVKELKSFLTSLIGYIVITVFLLTTGLFLWVFPMDYNVLDSGYANVNGLFMIAPFVFLFLIPAITMRSFADERKTGTLEFILTQPITDLSIILSKYFAGLVLVLFSILPTLIYVLTVYFYGLPKGNIDMGATWGSYIGLLFLGAAFVSIGIFSSSLTDNQIVSFIVSVFVCMFAYLGFEFIYSLDWFGKVDLFIRSLGIHAHYTSMSRGVIDTRDVLYFLSFISFFIILTKLSLESRKWER
ncbi:MAG: gliding motility-associated ABC transporter permease subunit GldF [Bacteroidales bacterium]